MKCQLYLLRFKFYSLFSHFLSLPHGLAVSFVPHYTANTNSVGSLYHFIITLRMHTFSFSIININKHNTLHKLPFHSFFVFSFLFSFSALASSFSRRFYSKLQFSLSKIVVFACVEFYYAQFSTSTTESESRLTLR